MSVIVSILCIIVMIIIHEWGHFIAGRICKIPIYEFSIGFGPTLFKKKGKKETIFSIRAIPLGGFCAFDDMSNGNVSGLADVALEKLSFIKKIFISIAGPLMNIITALLLMVVMMMFTGGSYSTNQIDSISEDGSAYGIIYDNSTITSMNGIEVHNGDEITKFLMDFEGGEIDLKLVDSNGEEYEKTIKPKFDEEYQRYMMGITLKYQNKGESPIKAIIDGTKSFAFCFAGVFEGLFMMITGQVPVSEISGIVGAVGTMSEYATAKTISAFGTVAAYISIDLGIMNLLPIPPLDGFKILTAIIQKVFKKRLGDKVTIGISVASFLAITALSIVLIFTDTMKLIG